MRAADKAREFIVTMDRRYQQRVNYIFVAESMLLFSFVTTFASINYELNDIRIAIAFAGIATTFCWIVVNIHLSQMMKALRKKYLMKDSIYKFIYINYSQFF